MKNMIKQLCLIGLVACMCAGCASSSKKSQRMVTASKQPSAQTKTKKSFFRRSKSTTNRTTKAKAAPVVKKSSTSKSTSSLPKATITPAIKPAKKAARKSDKKIDYEDMVISSAYQLRPADRIVVTLRGIPTEEQIEDVVDERGYITLPYLDEIMAAGRTGSELERAIRSAYIDGKIYKNITVNVILPEQTYYVRGEVKTPGRYPLSSGVTILQAIAVAGGFTDFANAKKVKVVRGGKYFFVDTKDLERKPEKDVSVEAGDVIRVYRSVF